MTDTFTEEGFTVTASSTGVTITPVGGSGITITIPNFSSMSIDFDDGDTFHHYVTTYKLMPTSYISDDDVIWTQLLRQPAPLLAGEAPPASPITNGTTSHVAILGDVTHYVDAANHIVTNITQHNHLLDPGAVVRYLYEKDGDYYITTIGFGNGNLGGLNERLSDWVWNGNDARVARAAIYADNHSGSTTGLLERPLPDPVCNGIQPCFNSAISAASPLVIDLSSGHTGVTLTTWSASTTETFFDLNANGFAVQTAWVSGDTGLLARDLNSNGTIDSSAELFGSPTVDGFAKLAALDSNHDLRIDNNDADWSTLVVWTDDNGDAVTQSGELHSLASLGIANIDLAGVASSTSTISGNPISHTSKVTFTSGATATIADAWFVHDNTNSYYTSDYTLDVETLFLPALRGYGSLPDLTIAMSQDSDLKDLVEAFAASFSVASFADANSLKMDIEEILFKWAGVDVVDPASRGYNIDGQHLEFLEHLVGTEFYQTYSYSSNPQPTAAGLLEGAYEAAFRMFSTHLLLQVGVWQLFDTPLAYNPATGMPDGDMALSHGAINDLANIAPSTGPENEAFWVAVVSVLDTIKGIGNLTVSEAGWLDDAVTTSNALLDWSAVLNAYANENGTSSTSGTSGADTLYGGATDDTIHGLLGNDTIYGSVGNDFIYGDDGNNVLYGDEGDDYVAGSSGNDVLYGGDGNDDLHGGYGNDTYYGGAGGNTIDSRTGDDTFVYGGGDDVITEYGGTDQIILPSGIVLGDLIFSRVSSDNSTSYFDDLLIQIEDSGSIQIRSQFYSGGAPAVETLVFSDTSTLSLTSLAPDVRLTAGNDNFWASTNASYTIYGFDGNDSISAAGTGAHTIDGGSGNDSLSGGSGSNDTYIASHGFDTITENGGTDTIVIPDAYDASDVSFYRIGSYDLGILIDGLGEIKINSQLSYYGAVESLYFLSDSSTVDLTQISVATLGTSGNDNLSAPSYNVSPNDFMDGREGNDNLNAGLGNDTYVFSAGHDVINESGGGGDDTIRVRDSYGPEDIAIGFYQDPDYGDDYNMKLTDTDGNTIVVIQQGYNSARSVEHIIFGDDTVWDLSSIELNSYGTSGNDYMAGHVVGDASSNDTMYGYGGNDTINGGVGDDVIYGGDGADTLSAKGHSILYGDDGDDNIFSIAGSGDALTALVTMYGGNGADTLTAGSYGQSVMNGGAGADTLWGAGGTTVSTFLFDGDTAFDAVDTIRNFTSSAGHDKLDISDILDGYYDSGTDVITDFVQITTNGSNSELYVDTTGTATFGSSQHIATIVNVTGLTDEAALVTAGTLLAA
ncbi:Ca2+-binding RTX toxin-like protein [Bradyrhizobium japonicum]